MKGTKCPCEIEFTRNDDGEIVDAEIVFCFLHAATPDLLAACKEFVRKVDVGEARSKRSYAQMKAAIEKAEQK